MKLKIIVILILITTSAQAQEIYVVNSINEIKIINVQSLLVSELVTVNVQEVGYITDIAFAPDGRLYAVTNGWQLYEIDLVTGEATLLTDLPIADPYTALVCNSEYELFTSRIFSQELYSYDLINGTLEFIDNNIATPGDFTFYKGNLIYPNIFNDFIKAYDGSNILNIGCSIPFLYTFVNDFEGCAANNIYAFDQFANLYLFDLESENFDQIASFFEFTGLLNGGATLTEWLASDCPLEQLETVLCLPLNTNDIDFPTISLKANPVEEIIEFEISKPLELSYMIYNIDGKLLKKDILESNYISISEFSSGLYMLHIIDISGQFIYKDRIIKK
jgi:hypothetical protein